MLPRRFKLENLPDNIVDFHPQDDHQKGERIKNLAIIKFAGNVLGMGELYFVAEGENAMRH